MPEQYEPSAAAPKSVKLRESCDSCLVAKVKCSKGRPLCSRCLQNGSICGYSPSSRAGRKNRDSASTKVNAHKSHASLSRSNRSAPTPPFSSAMSRPSSSSENVQSQATNENGMNSSTTLGALDDQVSEAPAAENRVPTTLGGGSGDNFLPTPPFNDFLDTLLPLSPEVMFAELASAATSPGTCTAPSSTIPAWTSNGGDGTSSAPIPTSQGPLDRASFANFSQSQSHGRTTLPDLHDRRHHSAGATVNERPTCDCFAACLQALLSLHNHSWTTPSAQQGGPPFDVILSITRGAIEGGSAMLSCSKCVAKIGSGISTMLLATIFGKVMSLYRAACFFRFGAASGIHASAQLAFGSFTVTGEDRQLLEIEILLIELRKVENVLKVFQEKFDSSQAEKDETSVYHALTSYLEKNLYYIVQFLQARKQNLPRLSNGGR